MSRIGKKPIQIPEGVDVKIEGSVVVVKGPKGEISKEFSPGVIIAIEENKINVSIQPESEIPNIAALWGTTRALLSNMVLGVKDGFERKLQIEGLGFKANVVGQNLELSVGFTHTILIKAPEGVKFLVEKNIVTVSGQDLGKVSQTAADIKRAKPPEPYKGKGIRYLGEQIRKKVGKKAAAATGGSPAAK